MSNKYTSSLLLTATEGNEVPTLGGTEFVSEEYRSPLERLIAHSTSEHPVAVSAPRKERAHEITLRQSDVTNTTFPQTRRRISWIPTSSHTLRKKSSLLTLATSTCFILQIGFTWASFLSPSWLDTRLYLSLSLPSLKIDMNNSHLIHLTTLGSLLRDFLDGNQRWAAIALVLTSIIFPCLCTVCVAIWIVEDINDQNHSISTIDRRSNRQLNYSCARNCIEYCARTGFCLFLIFLILNVGTSPLEVIFMESRFIVVNEIKGGMTSYTLGMLFGILGLVLLRIGGTNFKKVLEKSFFIEDLSEVWLQQDYKCPWDPRITNADKSEEKQNKGELLMSLLQSDINKEETSVNRKSLLLDTENNTEPLDKHPCGCIQLESEGLESWKRIILYELALISTVLWIPAIFLPLFHLKYEGIVSNFMSEVSFSFRLKDFPQEVWERGLLAGVNRIILCVLEIIFVLLVLVCPLIQTLSAIGIWMFNTRSSNFCKRLLWSLQPFLGLGLFGVALYITIPAFETVSKRATDKLSSRICSNFETAAADTCFAIKAEPLMGLYFLLLEAIVLELFVFLTLTWYI